MGLELLNHDVVLDCVIILVEVIINAPVKIYLVAITLRENTVLATI